MGRAMSNGTLKPNIYCVILDARICSRTSSRTVLKVVSVEVGAALKGKIRAIAIAGAAAVVE